MNEETEQHETFKDACARFKAAAGPRFEKPDKELSLYAQGAWILNNEAGTVAICNAEKPPLFSDNLHAYFDQIALQWAAK